MKKIEPLKSKTAHAHGNLKLLNACKKGGGQKKANKNEWYSQSLPTTSWNRRIKDNYLQLKSHCSTCLEEF